MTSACSPRFNSKTMRMPSRSLSSRMSEMPSIFLSLTSAEACSIRRDLLTWYGISVTMICSRSLPVRSMAARARIFNCPRPVV